jgi:hypothetical protein
MNLIKTKRFLFRIASVITVLFASIQTARATDGAMRKSATLTQDDVLSIKNGCFYLDGKPFAEISFNKHDLVWALFAAAKKGAVLDDKNEIVRQQDQALADFQAMGLKTIRIFGLPFDNDEFSRVYADPVKREKVFYAAVNKAMDLCDRHGIRVVYSLAAHNFWDRRVINGKWEYGEEHMQDLLRTPESKSRKRLYAFLEEFIPRMKGRRAIAMWEIGNEVTLAADIGDSTKNIREGQRMPTLKDVADFYHDVRGKLKQLDPVRLVNNGGSNMRTCQWNRYQKKGWVTDTLAEQTKAFELLFGSSGIDTMDIHHYPNNRPGGGYPIKGADGKDLILDIYGYQKIATQLKKPLMIGELAVLPLPKDKWEKDADYFENFQNAQAANPWVQRAIDQVVDAGVPLTYWWTYNCERKGYPDLKKGRDDVLLAIIADGNRRIKKKLGTNTDL